MAAPTGSTESARRSGMRPARIEPTTVPRAATPISIEALSSWYPRWLRPHSMTISCSVAPAPQKRVVTASEIWPSLSFQSTRT
ncbi:hypothetical protein D9M69_691670 [compost metagenome]